MEMPRLGNIAVLVIMITVLFLLCFKGTAMFSYGNKKSDLPILGQVRVFKSSKIPELGRGEVPNLEPFIIAEMDNGNHVVTLCVQEEIVCIESAYFSHISDTAQVSGGGWRVSRCWDGKVAPKRIQELVKIYEQKAAKSALDRGYAPCS